MQKINRLAPMVVWKGFGFFWVAICTAMSGLIFDLALACRVGALLALVVAAAMQYMAETYHRVKRISETEIWILLALEERPSKETARKS